MRVAVVGLGSMGKRRLDIVRNMGSEHILYGVDARKDRRDEAASVFGIECVSSIGELDDVDCALICTSPLSHAMIVSECLSRNWHVFTELNLVSDGYEENLALASENNCVLFISSTFVYRAETRYIMETTGGRGGAYRYHVGQYLPDWHPWESFRDFFVADARTSGVREILAIELPWLTKSYGEIVDMKVNSRKMSSLAISYDDAVSLILQHSDGTIGDLVVDVVSRMPVRAFEYFDEEKYLTWNGSPESLMGLDLSTGKMTPVNLYGCEAVERKEGYASFIVENAYRRELEVFFDCINGRRSDCLYSFADDLLTLMLIDKIEGLR